LSYDIPHQAPWNWRVSLYTWTKGIAAGAYLVPLLWILGGWLSWTSALWLWAAPVLAAAALAATGALLIADLKHPERFYLIFTRPQWSSWLVRGAFIIAAFSGVLAAHVLAGLLGWGRVPRVLALPGLPIAALTAVYTAYLFAQARARDLWQNPLLPPHFLLQAVLAGSAALFPLAAWLNPGVLRPLLWTLAGSSLLHLLFVWGETILSHATAHAALAAHEMVRGAHRRFFWTGVGLAALGCSHP